MPLEEDLPLSQPEAGVTHPFRNEPRFVTGPMLGGVARWLRVLGFDTHYMRRMDETFLMRCLEEGRIFLTRDRKQATRKGMRNVLLVSSDRPLEQLAEVVQRLHLVGASDPLSRCLLCNEPLVKCERQEVAGEVPEYTWQTQSEFYRCPVCKRVYWGGSHRDQMLAKLEGLAMAVPSAEKRE